jgi:signal transduction histidine kinase
LAGHGDTTAPSRADSGKLSFAVDSALLTELGEQLVARKSVALAELIKNAYDADATRVVVTLAEVTRPGGSVTVQDNGTGMSFASVEKDWMRIATTTKQRRPSSPRFRRPVTGSKGIGRFAVRKLAEYLRMTTRARVNGAVEETVVEIDWPLFAPGTELVDVRTSYERRELAPNVQTGTTLEMIRARDIWDTDDVLEVRQDLQTLTSPFSSSVVDPEGGTGARFDVILKAPEFEDLEGSLTETFLSAAVARVRGRVMDDGTPKYDLHLRGSDSPIDLTPPDNSFADLRGAHFEVHYFKYDRGALAGTGVTVSGARGIGERSGGVKIYLDGFRVFPYGDPGDDWLDLDADRGRRLTGVDPILKATVGTIPPRAMLQLPGNNNLFGAVFVTRAKHPEIKPTINRSGLTANDAFADLKRLVRLGIDWMVVERARQDASQRKRREGSQVDRESLLGSVSRLTAGIRRDLTKAAPDLLMRFDDATEALVDEIRKYDVAQQEKTAALRVLASAGTVVVVFVHQMRAALDGLRRIVRDLKQGEASPSDVQDRLADWTDMLDAQASELGLMLGPSARRSERALAISPVVEQVIGTFQGYASDNGIQLTNSVPSGLRTPPIREAEMHSLLLNAVTNSLKAVKGEGVRRVDVTAERRNGMLVLAVRDTGHGLNRRDRERVFLPFQTTSSPDPVLGIGTGLGLTIVRDIVETHNGSAAFVDAEPPWITRLEISLPVGIS